MEVLHERCCGAVVSDNLISACVLLSTDTGREQRFLRNFSPFTQELLVLAGWLKEHAVTHLAIKATGKSWRPLFSVLQGNVEFVLVDQERLQSPPQHTNVPECQWLADLLRHELIPRKEFVSQESCYERRLSGYRARLVEQRQLWAVSIQDLLKEANLRLGSVLSDVMGESGRAILQAVLSGEYESERLAQLAKGRLRKKIPQLKLALEGQVDDRHRFLLREWLDLWTILNTKLELTEQEIQRLMSASGGTQAASTIKLRGRSRSSRSAKKSRDHSPA